MQQLRCNVACTHQSHALNTDKDASLELKPHRRWAPEVDHCCHSSDRVDTGQSDDHQQFHRI